MNNKIQNKKTSSFPSGFLHLFEGFTFIISRCLVCSSTTNSWQFWDRPSWLCVNKFQLSGQVVGQKKINTTFFRGLFENTRVQLHKKKQKLEENRILIKTTNLEVLKLKKLLFKMFNFVSFWISRKLPKYSYRKNVL